MNTSKQSSENVRPMLEAMSRLIDAARARRTASKNSVLSGSSEGTTSLSPQFKIGSPLADNGKAKAKPKSAASSFFRDRDSYRKAG